MSEENVVVEQETPVESTEQVEATETPTEETAPEFKPFEYSFDKETRTVKTEAELRELVEMGEYHRTKGKEGDDWLKSYAKDNNMSKSELLEAFKQQKLDQSVQQIADDRNVSLDVAKELHEGEILKQSSLTKDEEAKEQARLDENYAEFVKVFPDVKDVPPEVIERFAKGDISLIDAYNDKMKDTTIETLTSRLTELEEKLGINTKNTENAEASTGSVTGNGSTNETFYTAEQVRGMSKAEVKKNFNAIEKSMQRWK